MAAIETIEPSFLTFRPDEYLSQYYSEELTPQTENWELLKFFAEAYSNISNTPTLVEVGGGPTVYQLISAAAKVRDIYFTDFLGSNVNEVVSWKKRRPGSFNWKPYVKVALEFEDGCHRADELVIARREALLRRRLTKFGFSDVFQPDPLGLEYRGSYDIVSSCFCAESITSSRESWSELVGNICSLIKPEGGILITAALRRAKWYRIGPRIFPAACIDENDLGSRLSELGFQNIDYKVIPADTKDEDSPYFTGYSDMILLQATRS